MPRKKAKTDDPDPILICCNALTVNGRTFQHGRTYRKSEVPAEARGSFLSWLDSTSGERDALNAGIMEAALAPPPEPKPAKPKRMVKAKHGMLLSGARIPATQFGRPDAATLLSAGQLLPEDHPLVVANPHEFEKTTETADAVPETQTRG